MGAAIAASPMPVTDPVSMPLDPPFSTAWNTGVPALIANLALNKLLAANDPVITDTGSTRGLGSTAVSMAVGTPAALARSSISRDSRAKACSSSTLSLSGSSSVTCPPNPAEICPTSSGPKSSMGSGSGGLPLIRSSNERPPPTFTPERSSSNEDPPGALTDFKRSSNPITVLVQLFPSLKVFHYKVGWQGV